MAVATGTAILAGAGIAAAAPILGGIIGQQQSAADRARAQQAAQAAYEEIAKLDAPPDLSQAIILKHFKQVGLYTPQLEKDISAGFSQVSQIQEDKALRDSQMGGLNLLKERANVGGLSATDRASLNQIRQQAAIDQQGKLEAIKQNMAARGMTGGGSELAQELGAASAAGAEESAAADRIAAQAQQAALQAALQSGQLGGQIRQQDFDVAKAKADAADRFKLFDVQNSIARQQRNTASQNQGQLYNLDTQQQLENANTQMDNAEQARQLAAKRQYWQDQAQLAGMKSGAKLGQAQQYNSQADATAKMWQGVGSGAGAAGGSLASMVALGAFKGGTTPAADPNAHLTGNGDAGTNPYNYGKNPYEPGQA